MLARFTALFGVLNLHLYMFPRICTIYILVSHSNPHSPSMSHVNLNSTLSSYHMKSTLLLLVLSTPRILRGRGSERCVIHSAFIFLLRCIACLHVPYIFIRLGSCLRYHAFLATFPIPRCMGSKLRGARLVILLVTFPLLFSALQYG